MSQNESWWVTMIHLIWVIIHHDSLLYIDEDRLLSFLQFLSHNESPCVINMTHYDAWWLHDSFLYIGVDRLLSSLKIVRFHALKNSDRIVRFRPGSSALTHGSSALTHRSSALAQKIVCFRLKIVCFRPRSSALTQRSSAFVGIVCFHPFQDRLLWHPRIVRFRPYSTGW